MNNLPPEIYDRISRQFMERFGSFLNSYPDEVKKLTVELLTGTIVMNWAFKSFSPNLAIVNIRIPGKAPDFRWERKFQATGNFGNETILEGHSDRFHAEMAGFKGRKMTVFKVIHDGKMKQLLDYTGLNGDDRPEIIGNMTNCNTFIAEINPANQTLKVLRLARLLLTSDDSKISSFELLGDEDAELVDYEVFEITKSSLSYDEEHINLYRNKQGI
jgi:hypothetical protein